MKTSSSRTIFGVFALQGTYRLELRLSDRALQPLFDGIFCPDFAGDLIYNGAASRVFRSDWGNGIQADLAQFDSGFRIDIHFVWAAYFGFMSVRRSTITRRLSRSIEGQPGFLRLSLSQSSITKALQTWIYSVYRAGRLEASREVHDQLWCAFRSATTASSARTRRVHGLARFTASSRARHLHAAYSRYFNAAANRARDGFEALQKFATTTGAPACAR